MFYENPFSSSNEMNTLTEIAPPSLVLKFFDAFRNVYFPIQRGKKSALSNVSYVKNVVVAQPKRKLPITSLLNEELISEKSAKIVECTFCIENARLVVEKSLVQEKVGLSRSSSFLIIINVARKRECNSDDEKQ